MRDYARVLPTLWTGETGRQICKLGSDAWAIAAYLMTCPHANMIALYRLPLAYLTHDVGIETGRALEVLQSLSDIGFAHYDRAREEVWLPEGARIQIGEKLVPTDNRHKGALRELAMYRKSAFLRQFYEKYRVAFSLPIEVLGQPIASPLQAPSKPLLSQEQEQEHVLVASSLSKPDPDQPDRSGSPREADAKSGVMARAARSEPPPATEPPPTPYDLRSALAMPTKERATACVREKLTVGQFCRPAEWPEIKAFAAAVGESLGWRVALGSYPADGNLAAAVELLAAGYSADDLLLFAKLAAKSAWFQAEKSRRVLSSFTPKVVGRLLAEDIGRGAPAASGEEQERRRKAAAVEARARAEASSRGQQGAAR